MYDLTVEWIDHALSDSGSGDYTIWADGAIMEPVLASMRVDLTPKRGGYYMLKFKPDTVEKDKLVTINGTEVGKSEVGINPAEEWGMDPELAHTTKVVQLRVAQEHQLIKDVVAARKTSLKRRSTI